MEDTRIGKYEFDNKEDAQLMINGSTDEDGNVLTEGIVPLAFGVVELGFIMTAQGEYNEEVEVTPPTFSDKYSVDVFWRVEEPESWADFRIDIVGQGSHSFSGVRYVNGGLNKINKQSL